MALFNIYITHNDEVQKSILEQLLIITKNTQTIMASVQELELLVADLQASVDEEQAQIAALLVVNSAVVVSLQETIVSLEAQIAAGPSPEQLEAVAAKLREIKSDVEATTEA